MRSLIPLMRRQIRDVRRGDRGWLAGVHSGILLVIVLTIPKFLFIDSIGRPTPFLLYFAAVMVATYLGGMAAGFFTTLISAGTALVLFMDVNAPGFFLHGSGALLAFCLEGAAIAMVTGGFVVEKRKAAQAIAEEGEARTQLDVVLAAVDEGIILQDGEGRMVYANQAAASIAGCASREEFLAFSGEEMLRRFQLFDPAGEQYPFTETPARRLLRGESASEMKLRVRRSDTGKEHWALIRANGVRGSDGRLEYVVTMFRDVSEAHQKEVELKLAREWFQIALASIGDAVIATDAHGRINLLNPVAERLTGWTLEKALNRPLQDVFRIIAERTREPIESPVERVLHEGTVVGLANHTLLLRADGSEISIDDSAAPIRSSDGTLEGVILVFRNVSSKRAEEERAEFLARATEELSSSLEYRRTLSTVARLAVPVIADWCAVDILEDGEVVRLGVAHVDEQKIKSVAELERRYPSDPNSPSGVHQILRTGESQLIEEIPHELLAALSRDEEHERLIFNLGLRSYMGVAMKRNGKPFGVITFATAESNRLFSDKDLALATALADRASLAVENASLYRTAELARKQAETANRTKDEFLAMLGHELRNPLAPIRSALDLMALTPERAREREVDVIRRQVDHLVRLVDDLLDVARITNGRVELTTRCVLVEDIIERAKEIVWPAAVVPLHHLHLDLENGLKLNCDLVRVAQVVANLLTNAVKYTPEGGNIWVESRGGDDAVFIRVRDDGIGIGAKTLRQVFDLFVQEPQALDRAQGGLGLGLAIVKGLVSAHGGRVRGASAGIGQGSEFVVELPYGDLSAKTPSQLPPPRRVRSSTWRILIVDDNQDACELLAELLRSSGHQVETANDSVVALRLANAQKPQVALLDIGLPGMNGYELGAELRKVEGLEDIKLIAVTGYGQQEDRGRSAQAQFNAHLVKPVDLHALEMALDTSN